MAAKVQKRVLLVDDDEGIVSAVCFALERQGYRVIVANDGAEALTKVERQPPDLVLLDAVMPRRSGLIVLDRLRRGPGRTLPIIMMSGQNDPELEQFALSQGVKFFLRKPFDIEELLGLVERSLADPES